MVSFYNTLNQISTALDYSTSLEQQDSTLQDQWEISFFSLALMSMGGFLAIFYLK